MSNVIILYLFFLAFSMHIIYSIANIRAPETNEKIPSIPNIVMKINLIMFSSLIVSILALWRSFNWLLLLHTNSLVRVSGVILSVLGLIGLIISKQQLGKHYSPCYRSYIPKDIIKSGLYGFIRHPIYASNLAIIFGTFLISGSALVLIFWFWLLKIYYVIAKLEEKYLIASFPLYKNYTVSTGMFTMKLNKRIYPNVKSSKSRASANIQLPR